jgi:hypothetical protein
VVVEMIRDQITRAEAIRDKPAEAKASPKAASVKRNRAATLLPGHFRVVCRRLPDGVAEAA